MAQVFPLQNINDDNCWGHSELHKRGIQIKNGEYLQYQDYTRKSQVYRRSYGAFCGFFKVLKFTLNWKK